MLWCLLRRFLYQVPAVVFGEGAGNLSRVAGQKQTLQGLAGRTNFPPAIPFSLLFKDVGDTWEFMKF